MPRLSTRYIRIITHMFYLLMFSYLVSQRSEKIIKIKRIDRFIVDMKHILLWTRLHTFKDGQKEFIDHKCDFINCYLTVNRSLFSDLRYFDAIVFNVQDVSRDAGDLPSTRSLNQKYIFAANNSADNYPVCDHRYDDFFNWSWTYRTDSTIVYRFISTFNLHGEELGNHLQWLEDMDPLDNFQKTQFASKSIAAAIIMDNCVSNSGREVYVNKLSRHLAAYNLTVDVYGKCGNNKCKRRNMQPCHWRIRKNYYFYLAFEDSISVDYITTEVLYAYDNNAVPIVYGGATYEEFLPPNSYLDGTQMSEGTLAERMYAVITDPELYYDFFRWKNHYSIRSSLVLNPCRLCQIMNSKYLVGQRPSYKEFRKWWNDNYLQRCES
ncbi:alpha-(1,3)-fucosyltransferase C-like [Hyposmocoma kahamanoa]|uniref:alpha-(1,3)-fucosyltransferase C-like n=1 Tax=Hyposmocoma kahamanoa TaxID=1477025 RepID=UPI000E6DA348|nr:alpha-(1,3)-fucosyltransferase C-like [Hyposmocoma kahamanoa]